MKSLALERLIMPTFLTAAKMQVKRRDSFEKGMRTPCALPRAQRKKGVATNKKMSLSWFLQT